ncbi:zona pellucida sperm-binding protein 4-like [Pungitius pungitius]|uniref:zona pellucida sperm-binding protein 4-like n=1 Tax=Pungitius pungitius TaxID=134920 RepID=UPI002E165544
MAKRATSSVALALLGCVLWTAVNAHIPPWPPADPKGHPKWPPPFIPGVPAPRPENPPPFIPGVPAPRPENPPPFIPGVPAPRPENPPSWPPFYPGVPAPRPENPPSWPPFIPGVPAPRPENPPSWPPFIPGVPAPRPENPPSWPPFIPGVPAPPQNPGIPPQRPENPPTWHHPHPQWPHQHPKFDNDQPGPKIPQKQQNQHNQHNHQNPQTQIIDPNLPVVQNCDVSTNVRVPCGAPGISASGCGAINCCFDGSHCYYGKAVTVQCTKDGQFIVVVARDATLPWIDLDSISLLGDGPNCKYVDSNSAFVIYNFPVTACGTVVREEPGVIIYENRMTSSYEVGVGPLGVITRDSHYQLLFQARYIGTAVETLVVEVLPPKDPPLPVAAYGPIRVALRLASGVCSTKGCNEVDAAYTSFYTDADYPVTKILRDAVYVEVQLLEKTDPNLVLTLGRCWTTTSPAPHTLPQWDILVDGCPYTHDHYLSSLVPVTPSSVSGVYSHFRRFFFKMFTFVEPKSKKATSQQVYIHCSTAVCIARPGSSCEPTCYKKAKRDVEAAEQDRAEPKVVVTVGPVEMSVQ